MVGVKMKAVRAADHDAVREVLGLADTVTSRCTVCGNMSRQALLALDAIVDVTTIGTNPGLAWFAADTRGWFIITLPNTGRLGGSRIQASLLLSRRITAITWSSGLLINLIAQLFYIRLTVSGTWAGFLRCCSLYQYYARDDEQHNRYWQQRG